MAGALCTLIFYVLRQVVRCNVGCRSQRLVTQHIHVSSTKPHASVKVAVFLRTFCGATFVCIGTQFGGGSRKVARCCMQNDTRLRQHKPHNHTRNSVKLVNFTLFYSRRCTLLIQQVSAQQNARIFPHVHTLFMGRERACGARRN